MRAVQVGVAGIEPATTRFQNAYATAALHPDMPVRFLSGEPRQAH